jgi:hypothetical protein
VYERKEMNLLYCRIANNMADVPFSNRKSKRSLSLKYGFSIINVL